MGSVTEKEKKLMGRKEDREQEKLDLKHR